MLSDKKFLFTRYTQAPAVSPDDDNSDCVLYLISQGEGFINCAAFGAGIVEGILCGAEFVRMDLL